MRDQSLDLKLCFPTNSDTLNSARPDVIMIGAGHNGLTCAAYLARSGYQVLVLEARERIGGACTIEERWPGFRTSPCAYLLGLLHPVVIRDLGLIERGLKWSPATTGLFVPFEDGESLQLWDDTARAEAEIQRVAPQDLKGWRAFSDVKRRLRDALRPPDDRDLWLDPEPTREKLEARLQGDSDARLVLFDWSMAEYVDAFFRSDYLKMAYYGQGVIGTNARPQDPGTASIHFHHQSGRLGGEPGAWGYVEGGMGTVSILLGEAALEAGVTIATGLPVSAILPGDGVELETGERLQAPIVVCNADPKTTARLLGDDVDQAWAERVESIPMTGCTLKANLALSELPSFRAKPGSNQPYHQGQVNLPMTLNEWDQSYWAAREGRMPDRLWSELYFQTASDPTVAPPGQHSMSVFAQYVPYQWSEGDWESRRPEVEALLQHSLSRFIENIPDAVIASDLLGPPDVEARVGLSGGHIFQGECLPDYLWDRRLSYRTPMPGLYLCGAGTHPGGSVIGINGRNAALTIRNDHPAPLSK